MKKTVLVIFALILVFTANCAAYEFKLKYATHTWENDEFARLTTLPLFANITRATDGQVQFESHYAESLLKHNEMWDGIARGDADMGLVILSFYHKRVPLSNVMDLPTLPSIASPATMRKPCGVCMKNTPKCRRNITTRVCGLWFLSPPDRYFCLPTNPWLNLRI